MSTNNFYYKNRCVVVSDEDFYCDNLPKLSNRYIDSLRSYPRNEVVTGLNYVMVVLTGGYYFGACIDYIVPELDEFDDEDVTQQDIDNEVIIANKVIDDLLEGYGYTECKKIGQFSNGEAVYEKV